MRKTKSIMKKLLAILSIIACSLCLYSNALQAQIPISPNGITVVSDTTDADDSVTYADEDSSAAQVITLNGKNIESFFNLNRHLFDFLGVGAFGMFIICLLVFILIVLAPILLIALVLYLLLRKRKNSPACAQPGQQTAAKDDTAGSSYEKKDKAIMHIAIGIGIGIALYILDSLIGTAIGILIACYGIGEYANACRLANKEKKDRQ